METIKELRNEFLEMIEFTSPYWLVCLNEVKTYFENNNIDYTEDELFEMAEKLYNSEYLSDILDEVYQEVSNFIEENNSEKEEN